MTTGRNLSAILVLRRCDLSENLEPDGSRKSPPQRPASFLLPFLFLLVLAFRACVSQLVDRARSGSWSWRWVILRRDTRSSVQIALSHQEFLFNRNRMKKSETLVYGVP